MKIIGRIDDKVLLSDGTSAAVIDETSNTVVHVGQVAALVASAEWNTSNIRQAADVSVELAAAAVTSLDIEVFSASDRMYTIPKAVQEEAKRALAWRKEHSRGGTPVGIGTARTLADGGQIGIKKVRHIAKYFPRHEVDKQGKGYTPGEDNYPSNGRIAWGLWGGDSAQTWASSIVERENKKAMTASGSYAPEADTDLSSFQIALKVSEDISPEFFLRIHPETYQFDRLYKSENGMFSVLDGGFWYELGESFSTLYDLDNAVDGYSYPYSMHVPVDPDTAITASAYINRSPFSRHSVYDLNSEEAALFAAALPEIEWDIVDSVLVAAPAPAAAKTDQDGTYTPDERSEKALAQVRDAGGRFSKSGSRVVVGNDASKVGVVTGVNKVNKTVDIKLDSGETVNVPANMTKDATQPVTAPAPAPYSRGPLDVSGILGEPRDSTNPSLAKLPGRLPPLTSTDLGTLIGDWGSWVSGQRAQFDESLNRGMPSEPQKKAAPTADNWDPIKAPNAFNDPYLRKWLDQRSGSGGNKSFPNRTWYNPVAPDSVEAKESSKEVYGGNSAPATRSKPDAGNAPATRSKPDAGQGGSSDAQSPQGRDMRSRIKSASAQVSIGKADGEQYQSGFGPRGPAGSDGEQYPSGFGPRGPVGTKPEGSDNESTPGATPNYSGKIDKLPKGNEGIHRSAAQKHDAAVAHDINEAREARSTKKALKQTAMNKDKPEGDGLPKNDEPIPVDYSGKIDKLPKGNEGIHRSAAQKHDVKQRHDINEARDARGTKKALEQTAMNKPKGDNFPSESSSSSGGSSSSGAGSGSSSSSSTGEQSQSGFGPRGPAGSDGEQYQSGFGPRGPVESDGMQYPSGFGPRSPVAPKPKPTTTTTPASKWGSKTKYLSLLAAGEVQQLTPETSDVPPIYMAIVAQDDPQAVMDLVSLVPANSQSVTPTTFKRSEGKWVRDDKIFADLSSPTPPPVIVLDNDTLANILEQVDSSFAKPVESGSVVTASIEEVLSSLQENALSIVWGANGDILSLVAAGGADRNRGNAESLRRYWVRGEGAAKIRWGTGGDWKRCVRHLSKYMGERAKGYCNLRHKDALGFYPATHAKMIRGSADEFGSMTEVTDEDMMLPMEHIHAEHDDLFDNEWEPPTSVIEITIEICEAADDDPSLLAAGGLDHNLDKAEELRRYWTVGKGGMKIRWGTEGDWTRCVRHLEKYLGPRAKGYASLLHKEMTGQWSGNRQERQFVGRVASGDAAYSTDFIYSETQMVEKASLLAQISDIKSRITGAKSITAAGEMPTTGSEFVIKMVVPEEVETGDGRIFSKDSISMRDLPLPLLWQIKTAEGHQGSVVVGLITHMERIDGGIGNARGVFDSGDYGREAERLVRGGFIRGVSADLDRFEADEEPEEAGNKSKSKMKSGKIKITKARVMAVTMVPKPAFQECSIELTKQKQESGMIPDGEYADLPSEEETSALIACAAVVAAVPVVPPRDWFNNPDLGGPTPLTVTDDGRVFGHIAAWDVNHIGLAYGTKPPRSRSKYAYFHTGVVRTEDGSDMPVGQLTLAGGHAPLQADASAAAKHYDDTASAFADVHAGEDRFGIWVSGALRPSVSPEQVRAIRAAAPSGDWRPINGSLELVAVCQVNVPGFPIARARVASGSVMALVAAGAQVLARMKADPVAELAARIQRLEQAEMEPVLAAAEDARARFAALKGEFIISEEPVLAAAEDARARFAALKSEFIVSGEPITAGGGCGCCSGCSSMSNGSCCANCTMGSGCGCCSNCSSMSNGSCCDNCTMGSGHHMSMKSESVLVECLEKLLANTMSFYFRSHGYHLNIIGQDFSEYHELFGQIYLDAQGAIDPIAENIRKLGAPVGFTMRDMMGERTIGDSNIILSGAREMAADLLDANEMLVEELKYAFNVADASDEQAVANFLAERLDAHQKTSWKLASSVMPDGITIKEEAPESAFESVFSMLQSEGLIASANAYTEFADLSDEVRMKLAEKGQALPDGSYPIRNVSDLRNAVYAYGRAKASKKAKVRRHIAKRARALGKPGLIPQEWKEASTFDSEELSTRLEDMRSRIALTAATGVPPLMDPAAAEGQGGADPKAPFGSVKYTAKTQPRDAQGKFRVILARLKQDLGDASLDAVANKVGEVENLDFAGNYSEAAKAANEVIDIVDRLDTGALDATSLENVRASTKALGTAIANLPLPFKNQAQKIRYSDIPPALRDLIEDMMARVEDKIGQKEGAVAVKSMKEFMTGSTVMNQGDISSEMNKLLRLLT